MCDCQLTNVVTRREAIVGGLAVGSAIAIGAGIASAARVTAAPAPPSVPAVEVMPGLSIYPRDAWGANLPPVGPIERETAQFLMVHHTASSNAYSSVAMLIQATYAFHTSSAKGWSDVCYEFFIGRDGDVWEGRAGALVGPVVADATGGSQGFAQLICLLGDFTSQSPTASAMTSLVNVLAWLSDRYFIDVGADVTTSFISRGSQRWPAGTPVTVNTIAGHRDMSYTACPGDALYPLLPEIRAAAVAQRAVWKQVLKPARRLGAVAP
ncbi:MAG: peptidoglycan recognition family protein [Ilumatobacteraceae bacterium]